MARQSAFTVKIDVAPVSDLADKLSRLSPERVADMIVSPINDTALTAYELSRKTILNGINLTDGYVQDRMQLELAKARSPVATITAFGGKDRITSLSHYGAMQGMQSALHPQRAKGDAVRGIPAGQKAAGMPVEVVIGNRKVIQHGFTLLKKDQKQVIRDGEGNPVVFTRSLDGRIRSRTGPSVYQLFHVAGAKIESQVYDDLEQTLVSAVELEFLQEFK